jgi:hypothetical protein
MAHGQKLAHVLRYITMPDLEWRRGEMENQPPESQESVSASNGTINMALKCTSFVLRRAHELPSDQQKPMLAIVRALIALEEDQSDQPF